jgi:hypothetical protein
MLSLALLTGTLVVMFFLLRRYRIVVTEQSKSTGLARDMLSYFDMRLKTQDERIVDLLARVELLSVRIAPEKRFMITPAGAQSSRPDFIAAESQVKGDVLSSVSRPEATERAILRFLLGGPRSSVEIARMTGKSREHSARLMKGLFQKGYVSRSDEKKPFVYNLTDVGRSYLDES